MTDKFSLIIPPCSVRWYEAGEHCDDAQAGDFILIDHGTVVSDAISLGQKLLEISQSELTGFVWCTHTAFSRGQGILSEMAFSGYERKALLDYKHRLYAVAHFDVDALSVLLALAYDDALQGIDYGWGEYLPLILDGLTDAKFGGTWGDAIICSTYNALIGYALGCFPDRLASNVIPAHWALWTGARH